MSEANETAASPAPVHPIVIQPLEFLASRRKIAGVSSRTILELLENAERLEHALRNIAIQTDDGSQAREICDRVLAGIFFP